MVLMTLILFFFQNYQRNFVFVFHLILSTCNLVSVMTKDHIHYFIVTKTLISTGFEFQPMIFYDFGTAFSNLKIVIL